MSMDPWNNFGPSATALRNLRDGRAGAFKGATEYDSNEYDSDDSDESATVYSLEGNLSNVPGILPGTRS